MQLGQVSVVRGELIVRFDVRFELRLVARLLAGFTTGFVARLLTRFVVRLVAGRRRCDPAPAGPVGRGGPRRSLRRDRLVLQGWLARPGLFGLFLAAPRLQLAQ